MCANIVLHVVRHKMWIWPKIRVVVFIYSPVMTNFPVDKGKKLFIKNDRNKLTRCAWTITKKNSHNTNFSTKLLFILVSWLLLKYPVTERRERN